MTDTVAGEPVSREGGAVNAQIPIGRVLRRVGLLAWSVVGIFAVLWALTWLLSKVQILIAPVVLATALIYVLNPLVNRLARIRVPRIVGALAGFLLILGGLVLIGFLVAPSVADQASSLSGDFPRLYEESASDIESLISGLGFGDVDLWSYDQLQDFVKDPQRQDQLLSALFDNIGKVTTGLLEAILVFFVAPVVAFYVLIDLPRVRRESVSLIPQHLREEVVHVAGRLSRAIGGFLRGQMLVAVIVGVMTSFGFWLIGLEFWLIIGLIAGSLNIIPFVGPWVGGALGVVVGLVTGSLETAALAALVAFVVQQIDNHFVSPTVLRATVQLHPAVVILVLILGGTVGGLWGVVLAVPVTASVKILVGHLWRTRVLGQRWEEIAVAGVEDGESESDRAEYPADQVDVVVGDTTVGTAEPTRDPETFSES